MNRETENVAVVNYLSVWLCYFHVLDFKGVVIRDGSDGLVDYGSK